MNNLMMTLQQPLSVAALAHCLGWGAPPQQAARAAALRRRRRARSDTASANTIASPALQAGDGQDDDTPTGCGWFDSSRELHQGLVVLEHSGAESLGAELPITVWLNLVLEGSPGPAPQAELQATAPAGS